MSKTTNFVNAVTNTVNNLNTVAVKESLGDSTNNNRTLSVRQLIRFLSATRGRNAGRNRALASDIETVYNRLRSEITYVRSLTNSRTDAVDIQEFITELDYLVSVGRTAALSRVISSW